MVYLAVACCACCMVYLAVACCACCMLCLLYGVPVVSVASCACCICCNFPWELSRCMAGTSSTPAFLQYVVPLPASTAKYSTSTSSAAPLRQTVPLPVLHQHFISSATAADCATACTAPALHQQYHCQYFTSTPEALPLRQTVPPPPVPHQYSSSSATGRQTVPLPVLHQHSSSSATAADCATASTAPALQQQCHCGRLCYRQYSTSTPARISDGLSVISIQCSRRGI